MKERRHELSEKGKSRNSDYPAPLHIKDILSRKIVEVPYLVDQLIPQNEPFGIFGAGESFKTWFALETCRCVSSGEDVLGQFKVNRPGPVVYFDEENDGDRLCVRCTKLGFSIDQPFYAVTDRTLHGKHFGSPDFFDQVCCVLGSIEPPPVLGVFDSFARFFRGDENKAADIAEALGFLSMICRKRCISLGIIHHTRKGGYRGGGSIRDRVRGSGDFTNAISSGWFLERMQDTVALHQVKNRDNASMKPLHLRFDKRIDGSGFYSFQIQKGFPEGKTKGSQIEGELIEILKRNNGKLTQAKLISALESIAGRTMTRNCIRSLQATGLIVIEDEGKTGRGNSPVVHLTHDKK